MKKPVRALLALTLSFAAIFVAAEPASAGPSVEVRSFGSAAALGAPDMMLNGRVVDIAGHPSNGGYWILGRDGGVFSYGTQFYGSTGSMRLNKPVVGMAPTPSGNGYWFVAEDGGIFSFGDAQFYGSTGSLVLNSPIVGMAATPSGNGYWLVALDGGVFGFGDAHFFGSGAGSGIPVTAIVPANGGTGYTLLGFNGSLRSFGNAPVYNAVAMPQGAVDAVTTASGNGVWVLGADGSVYSYGDAPFAGAATNSTLVGRGIARSASGGYWVAVGPPDYSYDGPPIPANSGTGRRIVYSNPQQRVWLIEEGERVAHTFLVSGKQGVPRPGTYHVFSKSAMSSAHGGELRLPYMTRFTWGSSLAIGFHGIPLRGNGSPIQSDAELGQYRSAGCVRMNQNDVKTLWNFAPVGTKVVVTWH